MTGRPALQFLGPLQVIFNARKQRISLLVHESDHDGV